MALKYENAGKTWHDAHGLEGEIRTGAKALADLLGDAEVLVRRKTRSDGATKGGRVVLFQIPMLHGRRWMGWTTALAVLEAACATARTLIERARLCDVCLGLGAEGSGCAACGARADNDDDPEDPFLPSDLEG